MEGNRSSKEPKIIGAGIGGAAGAMIGAVVGGPVGALIGAGVAALVGHKAEQELRKKK